MPQAHRVKMPMPPDLSGQDPFHAANRTGDQAAQGAEEQARRQRPDIPHVQHQRTVIDADMVRQHGAAAVDQANDNLQPGAEGFFFVAHLPQETCDDDIDQCREGHSQDHVPVHVLLFLSAGGTPFAPDPPRSPVFLNAIKNIITYNVHVFSNNFKSFSEQPIRPPAIVSRPEL